MTELKKSKIAIIGLGYVGLPLAVEFAKKFITYGFDINSERVKELNNGIDHTLEVENDLLKSVIEKDLNKQINNNKGLYVTTALTNISDANVFIVTVPTPIDESKRPDLIPLLKASETIGKVLKKGDLVIYESTTYPGCTEDDCVPVLEKVSGLKFNYDFFVGYSPERINPGDKINTLTKIKKVTSGSTPEAAEFVDQLYGSIIDAGTYKASSIKVAEASKAIENAQRDVNISFVNELALIFDRIGIDTNEVLEAAGTKWNFLKYKPGLVGGHCIGVDPYYLAFKAEQLGYHPAVILSGRRVNDQMGKFVAQKMIKLMIEKGKKIKDSKVLLLGITFKENCPDVRNTKVIDIVEELKNFHVNPFVYDPLADKKEVEKEYGIKLESDIQNKDFDGLILAVAHNHFLEPEFLSKVNTKIIYDVKGVLPNNIISGRL